MGKPVMRSLMVFEDANMVPNQNESKLMLIQPIFNPFYSNSNQLYYTSSDIPL
jgi:hypothetical protein